MSNAGRSPLLGLAAAAAAGVLVGVSWQRIAKALQRVSDSPSTEPNNGGINRISDFTDSTNEAEAIEKLLLWWFDGVKPSSALGASAPVATAATESYSDAARARWFANGPAQEAADAFIEKIWGSRVEDASAWAASLPGLDPCEPTRPPMAPPNWITAWQSSARGSLALVILLDQFSRHVKRYRSSQSASVAATTQAKIAANVASNRSLDLLSSVDVHACSAAARREALRQWTGIAEATAEMRATLLHAEAVVAAAAPLQPRVFVADRLHTSELVFLLMPFRHGIDRAFDPRAASMSSPKALVSKADDELKLTATTGAAALEGFTSSSEVETLADRRAQLRAVLNRLEARDAALEAEGQLVTRFRKQTMRALATADDLAKAPLATTTKTAAPVSEEGSEAVNATNEVGNTDISNASNNLVALGEEFGDLLERLPAACGDESLLARGDDPLLQTIDKFLKTHLQWSRGASVFSGSTAVAKQPILALSLSGGVDSMVLLRLLACPWLRERHGFYRVLCMHVNYGNRREAGREAQFVETWVRQFSGGAPLGMDFIGDGSSNFEVSCEAHLEGVDIQEDTAGNGTVKTIEKGISEGNGSGSSNCSQSSSFLWCETLVVGGGRNDGTMRREDFEADSRKLRFDFYKAQMAKLGGSCEIKSSHNSEPSLENGHSDDTNKKEAPLTTGVLLAHHLGDVEENVLSNVMRGSPPDVLSGMREVGSVEGAVLWRPLLPWRKDEILRFAHMYGVPYFLDSTPSWSTRFALRQRLLPCIEATYGDGAHRNLASLAIASDALHDELDAELMQPLLRRAVVRGPLGICIRGACREAGFGSSTNSNSNSGGSSSGSRGSGNQSGSSSSGGHSAFWWRLVLLPLVHSLGNPMLSEKALQTLLQRLRGDPPPVKPQQAPQKIEAKRAKAHAKAAAIAAAKGRELPSKYKRGDPSRANAGAAPEPRKNSKQQSNNCINDKSSSDGGGSGNKGHGGEGGSVPLAPAPTSAQHPWPRDGWLELRKEWGCYLERGDLYLLKQTLTPSGGSIRAGNNRKGSSGDDKDNEGHVAPGTRLPLPSLSAVLAAAAKAEADGYSADGSDAAPNGGGGHDSGGKKWSVGGPGAEVQGPVVQWGPWKIQAVVCLVRNDNGKSVAIDVSPAGHSAGAAAPTGASLASGFVWLADGVEWTRTNTQTKQAALLPLQELPALATPLLGDLPPSNPSIVDASAPSKGAKSKALDPVALANVADGSAGVVPSMSVLLTGSMTYALLMPLPRYVARDSCEWNSSGTSDGSSDAQAGPGGSDWDWRLELQPDAKLLPLRNLDRTVRKLVPLVAPVPVGANSSKSGTAPVLSAVGNADDSMSDAVAHCYVEIRYTFSD